MSMSFTQAQNQAISILDRNVSVSAGAGSGKTRVLVERFVNILSAKDKMQKNVKAKNILAITFTRKAANEMKERIRSRIRELEQQDPVTATFWHEQLADLEQARISTIHGFCNSLLKENPVEAGLDPAFQVTEEVEQEDFRQQTVHNFVRKQMLAEDFSVLTLADEYGATEVVQQILHLLPLANELNELVDWSFSYKLKLAKAELNKIQLQQLLKELVAGRQEIKAKKHRENLEELAEHLPELLDAVAHSDQPSQLKLLDRYIKVLGARCADAELVSESKELLEEIHLVAIDSRAITLLPYWQKVIKECFKHLEELQSTANILGFDDLENKALELLKQNPDLRSKYQQRFRYIMVDEFQDTNEKQRQIIYLLCGNNPEELTDNKLFIVGDGKQSIYRFRGADVSVFARVCKDIKRLGGENIVLDDNFRTVDSILELCNQVFSVLLGADRTQDVYFESLQPNRSSDIVPELLAITFDKNNRKQRREAEAKAVVSRIVNLHQVEKIDYSEIVILLSVMTNAKVFAGAMELAGVPYQIIDGKGFYEKQEIIDVINLLTFCNNTRCNLELAGLLRSPFFAFDDEVLTKIFLKLHELNSPKATTQPMITLWQFLMQISVVDSFSKDQIETIELAVSRLKILVGCAQTMPLSELVAKCIEILQIVPLLTAQEFGQEKLANVKKLFSLAKEFVLTKEGSLAAYLKYVAQLRATKARESTAGNNAVNAVTIMTIHKSKGLEFPVVFLPALDARGRADGEPINYDRTNGVGIKVAQAGVLSETSVFKDNKERNKALNTAEKQRQLYVAMTRAKNRLILSGTYDPDVKGSSSSNWFQSLREIICNYDAINVQEQNVENALIQIAIAEKETLTEQQVLRNNNWQPLAEYNKAWQHKLSPTALQQYLFCQRQFYYNYVMKMPAVEPESVSSVAKGLTPAEQGSVIHKALELYQENNFEKAWHDAVTEIIPTGFDDAVEARELLIKYIESPLYQEIAPLIKYKERAFALPLLEEYGVKTVFQGIIDCMTMDENNFLSIIDYKTGKVPEHELQIGYLYQLVLYQKAAELLLASPVKKVALHFLQNSTEWILKERVEDVLPRIASLCQEIFQKEQEEDFAPQQQFCKYCSYAYFCPAAK